MPAPKQSTKKTISVTTYLPKSVIGLLAAVFIAYYYFQNMPNGGTNKWMAGILLVFILFGMPVY